LASGPVTTLELTTASMDSVYNISWLDPAGELLLQDAADIPSDMVPAWRVLPKPSSKTLPIVLGVVIGVLGLAVVGVVVFIVVRKVRDRAAEKREEMESRVDAYEVDGPPKTAGRPHIGPQNHRVAHPRHHHPPPPLQQQWRGASRDGPPRTGGRVRTTSELAGSPLGDGPGRLHTGMLVPPPSSGRQMLSTPLQELPPGTAGSGPLAGGRPPTHAWGPSGAPRTASPADW
jgi:hypothetical protein